MPNNIDIKPFLKWAGGKTQLIPELNKYIPLNYNNYIEPFIGGGAFFFNLQPPKAIISDLNEDLIITYQSIRDNLDDMLDVLKEFKNTEKHYYKIRSLDVTKMTKHERAARVIYLNKTCYNGLYRVNKRGEFNVPYGKRKTNFYNEELLKNVQKSLKKVKIIQGDYLTVLKKYAKKDDFIFLDPPYYPVGKNSDFKRYTKEFFYEEDHVRLKAEFSRLVELGCNVILTNSDHPFILDLYKEYEILLLNTKRMISCNSKTRIGKDALIIGRI